MRVLPVLHLVVVALPVTWSNGLLRLTVARAKSLAFGSGRASRKRLEALIAASRAEAAVVGAVQREVAQGAWL